MQGVISKLQKSNSTQPNILRHAKLFEKENTEDMQNIDNAQ